MYKAFAYTKRVFNYKRAKTKKKNLIHVNEMYICKKRVCTFLLVHTLSLHNLYGHCRAEF